MGAGGAGGTGTGNGTGTGTIGGGGKVCVCVMTGARFGQVLPWTKIVVVIVGVIVQTEPGSFVVICGVPVCTVEGAAGC
jgi:hypothetical protein